MSFGIQGGYQIRNQKWLESAKWVVRYWEEDTFVNVCLTGKWEGSQSSVQS